MSPNTAPLDLDALTSVAGRVVVHGQEHEVRPLDGASYHLLSHLQASFGKDLSAVDAREQAEYVKTAFALVRRLVPTLTDEAVDRLNERQVGAIIQIATGQIDLVTKQIQAAKGNGDAPAKKGRARG